jgi:phenylpropionate dioxygenase-like ring-hydroxylating dioxygenase large terminal subunit
MPQLTTERPGCHVPDGHGATLDAERYTDTGFLEAEWRGVWSRCWLFAGLLSDVPDEGDYFVYELARESVVIVRDADGELRGFYNVCQHRGNRLLASREGYINKFSCPYHGWEYNLAGELQQVPDADRFQPPLDFSQLSLKAVKVEQWAGLVWINLDPNAGPLSDYLGSIPEELAGFHFERMILTEHQTVSLRANWKTLRDNFLEQYHVDFIHPQHASFVDCSNSTNVLYENGHSSTQVEGYVTNSRYPLPSSAPPHLVPLLEALGMDPSDFDGAVAAIRGQVQLRKRALAEELSVDFSELSDEQLSDVWQYDIFPNTFMTIQAEELWVFGPRPHPTDPDQCLFDKWTLQLPVEQGTDAKRGLSLSPSLQTSQDAPRPEHDSFDHEAVIAGEKSLTITIDQDIFYLAGMQAGMHSAGFDRARINQDEVRIQHFHDWVNYYLDQS